MRACSRLALIALCLIWTCATRVSAQEPSPRSNQGDLDNAGSQADGDAPAAGEAGASPISTPPQPPPFGGPWNSRPKLRAKIDF